MEYRPGFTGRTMRFAATHPWQIVVLWVVLLGAAFGASNFMNLSNLEGNQGTEAIRAADLVEERLRENTPPEEFVIVESPTADSKSLDGFVDSLVADLDALEEVDSVTSYRAGNEDLLSQDGRTALVVATLIGDEEDAADTAEPLIDRVSQLDGSSGFKVTTVGFGSVEKALNEELSETLEQGELIGIVFAVVILLFVLGAVVAAGLPIVLALLSIFVAVGATALVSNVMTTSQFVVFIITLVGLAVGIDYSLFIVHRYREERALGREKVDAISIAGATAGRAVFFSGMAVAIALAGMLVMPDPVFQSFAVGAVLVVMATVLAALTLLPAALGLLGDRVNWLTVPFIGSRGEPDSTGGVLGWIIKIVTAQPVVSALATSGLLIALAVPLANLNLGNIGITNLPESSDARHAFDVLNREFSDGVLTADVVIDAADVNASEVKAGIGELTASLEEDDFFGASRFETNQSGDLALLTVAMPDDFSSPDSKAALARLREDYLPVAFSGVQAEVLVGGPTAETVDAVQVQRDYLPFAFIVVLGFSFVLLLLVFRSVVVPLKAVIMNLLSVGAAYGILVLVFQEGIGNEFFGFRESPVIQSWLPLFLFAILFGLSMDYHVFLLSRIKERYDETRDNSASVAYGLRQTGGIITGAALIMVAVFTGMASGELVMFQQVGFGLAVAIILDATIIRIVLVPASMALLGDWNWYFPSWLRWLPELQIEGAAGANAKGASVTATAPATAD